MGINDGVVSTAMGATGFSLAGISFVAGVLAGVLIFVESTSVGKIVEGLGVASVEGRVGGCRASGA